MKTFLDNIHKKRILYIKQVGYQELPPYFEQAGVLAYVTRFYRTDPNRTSGKIKLTPPVDSYTIVLQVLTLSTTQTTRGWFLHTSFLGGVEWSNGGFRLVKDLAWQESVVYWWTAL